MGQAVITIRRASVEMIIAGMRMIHSCAKANNKAPRAIKGVPRRNVFLIP
jgi:hypothetical protein